MYHNHDIIFVIAIFRSKSRILLTLNGIKLYKNLNNKSKFHEVTTLESIHTKSERSKKFTNI